MRTKYFALPFAALALGLSIPAHAEEASGKTKEFIEKAAVGGIFEIETSKAALTSSTNADVKAFAQKMVDDHTSANAGLKAAVASSGITSPAIPVSLDKEHQDKLSELKAKKGADFNEEYIDEQADAHEDAVSLFKDYAKDGDNAVLKKFAADTLPTLQAHKAQVDSLDKAIN